MVAHFSPGRVGPKDRFIILFTMPYADPEKRRIYHRDYKRGNRWRYQQGQALYDRLRNANERAVKYGVPGVLSKEDVIRSEERRVGKECRL